MTQLDNTSRRAWDAPVLRNFAPPRPTQPDVESGEGVREVVPWEQPGTPLRTKIGRARRGFYAPRLQGAPTTTRQAEILNGAVRADEHGLLGELRPDRARGVEAGRALGEFELGAVG